MHIGAIYCFDGLAVLGRGFVDTLSRRLKRRAVKGIKTARLLYIDGPNYTVRVDDN